MHNPFKRSAKAANPSATSANAAATEADFPKAPTGHHFLFSASAGRRGAEVIVELAKKGLSISGRAHTSDRNEKTLEARLAGAMHSLVNDHNTRAANRSDADAAIKKAKAANSPLTRQKKGVRK